MLFKLLLLSLLGTVTAEQLSYGVSFIGATDDVSFNCIKQQGLSTVMVRVFDGVSGSPDLHAPNTIRLASKAGLTSEAFHVPSFTQSANAQIDAAINNLKNNGVNVRKMWLQVTDISRWGTNTTANQIFIIQAAQRIWRYGVLAGIYTSQEDWRAITLNLAEGLPNTPLWYINAPSFGEGTPNFYDFSPFGPWLNAEIKQYAVNTGTCGLANAGKVVLCGDANCLSGSGTTGVYSVPPRTSTYQSQPTTPWYWPTWGSTATNFFSTWKWGQSTPSYPYGTNTPSGPTYNPYASSPRPVQSSTNNYYSSSGYPYTGPTSIPTSCPNTTTTCGILYRSDCSSVVVWGWEWLYDVGADFVGKIRLAYVMKGCTLQLYDKDDWKGTPKSISAPANSDSWTSLSDYPNAMSAKCNCKS